MRHPLAAASALLVLGLAACNADAPLGPSSPDSSNIGGRMPQQGTGTAAVLGSGSGGIANVTAGGAGSGGQSSSSNTSPSGSNNADGSTGSTGSTGNGGDHQAASPQGGGANGGGSNGGASVSSAVVVTGAFEVTVPGQQVIASFRTTPVPAAAGGECGVDASGAPNGTWTKTTNGTTSTHRLHPHCTVYQSTPDRTVLVSFSEPATYVQAPSGNLNLNFASSCAVNAADPLCADRKVHYRTNGNTTAGSGVLLGHGNDGSSWTIDLAQIAHAGSMRSAKSDGIAATYRRYTGLTATQVGGASYTDAALAW